jgi:hypothetical protein
LFSDLCLRTSECARTGGVSLGGVCVEGCFVGSEYGLMSVYGLGEIYVGGVLWTRVHGLGEICVGWWVVWTVL